VTVQIDSQMAVAAPAGVDPLARFGVAAGHSV
jgi:hypothetical protein